MNIILDRIYNELKRLKKVSSKGDFADKLQYNRTYMSELMNSENKEIPEKLQVSLQTVFGIHPKFIETGEGKMFIEGTSKVSGMPLADEKKPIRQAIKDFLLSDWINAERNAKEIEELAEVIRLLEEKNKDAKKD